MIIAHPDLNQKIEINRKCISEWIIESPELFSSYLTEIEAQSNGAEGKFILSENEKILNWSKCATVIFNPIALSTNDKKVISKIYGELQEIAISENCYIKTKEIISMLQQYLLELEYHFDLNLSINDDVDLQGLFKLFGIKVAEDSPSLFEQLLQYIKIQNLLLGKKLVIIVNVRSFFTEEQLSELFAFTIYNEIGLLLIESFQKDFTNSTKKYIIDKDKCEI